MLAVVTLVPLPVLTLAVLALAIVTLTVVALPILALTIVALALIFATRTVVAILIAPPLVATAVVPVPVVAVAVATLTIATIIVVALLAGLFARADRFALGAEIVVAVIVVPVVERVVRLLAARLGLAVLEPAALFAQHAEIMVRELQVIFDIDPVAGLLRVAGEILVLLVKLRRVAACTTVDAIAVVATLATALARIATAASTTTIIATTTATAAGLPIIDQACVLVLKTNTGLAPKSVVQTPDRAPLPAHPVCHGHRTAAAS